MQAFNAQRIKSCQRKTHNALGYAMLMDSISDRLRAARIKAGYETSSDAARAFGWTISTYAGHENGSRGIRENAARRYAAAFNVSVEWLSYGTGAPKGRNTPPSSSPSGFSEPAAEPLPENKSLTIRAFQKKVASDPKAEATPFRVARDFMHFGILANDVVFVNLRDAARTGDIVLVNQVDPITASATTLIRRLIGRTLVGSPTEAPLTIDDTISIAGPIDGSIRIINTR
jgi:transcriptional regulator with XRE-family HTH domain